MNLLRITSRASSVLARSTMIKPPMQVTTPLRNIQTTAFCNYAERKYTKKVFTPSFGIDEVAKVEEHEVVDDRKTESETYLDLRKERKKVRTFKKLDKIVLVMLGKYKSIKDVPDQVTFSSLERKKEVEAEMKHLFFGSAFKFVYIFEYASFFITGGILAYALYWYNRVKKREKETDSTKVAAGENKV